ncbi:TPA: hypothetical protein KRE80_001925 [Clostridioides difficile]|nr:hypothetical protein [Clostridioides difficile]
MLYSVVKEQERRKSFSAPYRDRNCHFAKLMMKKECFSFHTLTTHAIPLLPTME